MLHGNLKVKFSVAGGEAIYAAIFFNNRNHADDTNSVIALMGNGDLILEDRFYGVGVDHINTEAVALFIDFKFDVGVVRMFHLLTGVDGIFECISKQTAQIHNLETGEVRCRNPDVSLDITCRSLVCIRRENQV